MSVDHLAFLRRLLLAPIMLALVLAAAVNAPTASAQSSSVKPAGESRSFLPPRATEAPPTAAGPLTRFTLWLTAWQARINRQLADAVRAIRTGNPLMATLLLASLSFGYGILHAAGPGHGKAVISSYVLANERTVRRGIALSFLAAFFQGLSALVLVGILVIAFKATGLTIKATEAWLETASWGLVALIGAWLLYRQVKLLLGGQSTPPASPAGEHGAPHHGHGHDHHGHSHSHSLDHSGHHHHHDHHHHDDGSCCNHAHMPDPRQLEGEWSWRRAIPLALAVGIRPCTGAILVLVFALSQGLLWAGVIATFAMALGTAITVSALAALAVGSRELATRLGGGVDSVWGGRIRILAGVGGASLVLVLGLLLMVGSLNGTNAAAL